VDSLLAPRPPDVVVPRREIVAAPAQDQLSIEVARLCRVRACIEPCVH